MKIQERVSDCGHPGYDGRYEPAVARSRIDNHGEWLGIKTRIADNTFGRVLPRLCLLALMGCLHRLVKAEHRRDNLMPTRLSMGTVAIDGKNVATLRWHDMCRVLELGESEATPEQVKALFAERYPDAQVCIPTQGKPYALMRVHTVTLISSDAAICVHQRPTLGHSNEIGFIGMGQPELLDELKAVYGRTRLIDLVTPISRSCRGEHVSWCGRQDRRIWLALLRANQVRAGCSF